MAGAVLSEEFYRELEEKLNMQMSTAVPQDVRIAGWRYDISEETTTSAGIQENKVGGPYAAPHTNTRLSGHLHVIWADGTHTSTSIDRTACGEFDKWLQIWKRTSYSDPDEPDIRPPEKEYPRVKLWDEAVAGVSGEEMFDLIDRSKKVLSEYKVGNLDGGVHKGVAWRTIRNSLGLDVRYRQTSYSFGFYADHIFGKYYGKRRLARETEIDHILTTIGQFTSLLKSPASLESGKMPVILIPEVTHMFVNQYLMRNLAGREVVNGHSAFSLEDFRTHKQVLREDMSLYIEPLRDFEYGSAPCTSEGIPSRRMALIENGCLQTPVLDLKYARKAGMDPTPSGPGLFPRQGRFSELIAGTERGLLVCNVLGLGSQDFSSGIYSVTADQALVIEGGELKGKVKATIAGNIFEQLNASQTEMGFDEFSDYPGLKLIADVVVE